MIHSFFLRQTGNRRQYAKGVSRQENDSLRMRRYTRLDGIRNIIERICRPGILRIPGIKVIRLPGCRVEHDIFQNGTITDCIINERFRLERKPDTFCITAALNIENAMIAPAMLIITDKLPVRIRRKRCLAGTRKSKEQRRTAICADIGRAVHRQDAFLRQNIVHHRENGLLHLTSITAATNEHHLFIEIQDDERLGMRMIQFRLSQYARHADDGKARQGLRLCLRFDEKLLDKKMLPGLLIDELHLQPIVRVGTGIDIRNIQLMIPGKGFHFCIEMIKGLYRARRIIRPADKIMNRRRIHNEFILR